VFSGTIEDLKKLNVNDAEVAEVVRLKKAGVTEDTIVSWFASLTSTSTRSLPPTP
jgi:hypothetical protein